MVKQDAITLANLVSKQISRLVIPHAIPLGHTIPNQIIERIGPRLRLEQPIPSYHELVLPLSSVHWPLPRLQRFHNGSTIWHTAWHRHEFIYMTTGSILQSSLKTVKPMLARLARHPFDSPDYLFELKWDGIRALAFIDGNELKLLSRTSRDITAQFPELAGLPNQIHVESAVLDGELVCMDESGHPSFSQLQQRLQETGNRGVRSNPVHFIAFDLLYLNGQSIMGDPLFSRKDRLHSVLESNEITQACDMLEPEGVGTKPFYLFKQALESTQRVAIAKVSLRQKEHICCLRPYDHAIAMHTMLYPDEIRGTADLELPEEQTAITDQEMAMAITLIDQLTAPYDPSQYQDEYRLALEQIIQGKLISQPVTPAPTVTKGKVGDLMEALKASIAAVKTEAISSEKAVPAASGTKKRRQTAKK